MADHPGHVTVDMVGVVRMIGGASIGAANRNVALSAIAASAQSFDGG